MVFPFLSEGAFSAELAPILDRFSHSLLLHGSPLRYFELLPRFEPTTEQSHPTTPTQQSQDKALVNPSSEQAVGKAYAKYPTTADGLSSVVACPFHANVKSLYLPFLRFPLDDLRFL